MIAAQHAPTDPALLGALSPAPPADPSARPASCHPQQSFDAAMKHALSRDSSVSPQQPAAEVAPPDGESYPASPKRPDAHAKSGKVSRSKTHRDATRPAAVGAGGNTDPEPKPLEAQSNQSLPGATDCLSPEDGSSES